MAKIDRDAFYRDGYAVVRGLFSPNEAEEIRESTIELLERLDREGAAARTEGPQGVRLATKGDMLTYESLRRVLLDPRLIAAVKDVLGDDPVYWGESAVNVGDAGGGARGWHTDSYDTVVTKGPKYPLVRCGLYFQDTVRHSDGLALIAGSHAKDQYSTRLTSRLGRMLRPWLGARRTVFVATEPGDFVVWDMRIVHSGEVVRLRPAPSFAVPLAWQGHIPAALRMPPERRRVAMFPTFGLSGPDLDSLFEDRATHDWVNSIWESSHFPPSVVDEAAAAGLRVIRPAPSYGQDDEVTQPPVESQA